MVVSQLMGVTAVTYNETNATWTTFNATSPGPPAGSEEEFMEGAPYDSWAQVLLGIVMGLLIVGTVFGNALVWIAVIIVKKLHQTPSNLLILSLAASDMLVGCLIMPLSLVYELTGQWFVGKTLCDVWTTFDVLLCTSSILTLCAISVDRYYAITRPLLYREVCTTRRVIGGIIAVWLLSGVIAFAPLAGWRGPDQKYKCIISQDLAYQIYATFGAFYIPMVVMVVLYSRIFAISIRISRTEARAGTRLAAATTLAHQRTPHLPSNHSSALANNTSPTGIKSEPNTQNGNGSHSHSIGSQNNVSTVSTTHGGGGGGGGGRANSRLLQHQPHLPPPSPPSSGGFPKAIKTLGVIMGVFTACWLPFFIVALIRPICPTCSVPGWLITTLTWLGYFNSFVNPIIYAKFNRDFRMPFKMILMCKCWDINNTIRREQYQEQFGPGDSRPSVAYRMSVPREQPRDPLINNNNGFVAR